MRMLLVGMLILLLLPAALGFSYADAVSGLKDPVVTTVAGKLWVPWFDRDDSCSLSNLHSGASCDPRSAELSVGFGVNCMVTDEFSQVGILYGLDTTEPQKFAAFVSTVRAINSSYGIIPAWRIFRNGETIEQCKSGINGNCDTASDATARIIIALYYGSSTFQNASSALLADQLAAEHLQYETVHSCIDSSQGTICTWLAAGAGAASGGRSSTDFGYTGYFPDAILAMQLACEHTGNQTFCDAAVDYQKQYLLAANWNGNSFSTPPGRSWKWIGTTAVCTNTCAPVQWDSADAPRALGLCGLSDLIPAMQTYCSQWKALQNPTHTILQYFPDGTAAASTQSGYYAQGLASQFYFGQPEFFTALSAALAHYNPTTQVWDSQACFGVYGKAFALRSFGESTFSLSFPANPVGLDSPAVNLSPPSENITSNQTIPDNSTIISPTQNLSENLTIPDAPPTIPDSIPESPIPSSPEPSILTEPRTPILLRNGPMQQTYTQYVATYEKSDLQPIVVDALGTGMAAFVENIDLIVISIVLLLIVGLAGNFRKFR